MNEINRSIEDRFLIQRIGNNPLFSEPFSFEDVIQALEEDRLTLEVNREEGAASLDDGVIEEILSQMEYLLRIAADPTSVIVPLGEKVPVETAKRINYKAISYLSRDSKDWYARTITEVKPKTVLSDVSYESYDTYENRFVYTLVRRLMDLADMAESTCRRDIEDYDIRVMVEAMNREMRNDSLRFYNRISKNRGNTDDAVLDELKNRLSKIATIKKRLRTFASSALYKSQKNKGMVGEPIHRNNVIAHNVNYRHAYELWMYLKAHDLIPKPKLEEEQIPQEQLEANYHLYSTLCILASARDMGFSQEKNGSKISFRDGTASIVGPPFKLYRPWDDVTVLIRFANRNVTELECVVDSSSVERDIIRMHSNYLDFEHLTESEFLEATRLILDSNYTAPEDQPKPESEIDTSGRNKKNKNKSNFKEKITYRETVFKYELLSIDLHRCKDAGMMSDKTYRRLYSVIGENFSDKEDEDDLKRWGSYNTGIALVCPTYLRDSFLKIEKILNYHIIRNIDFKNLHSCPVCGSVNVYHDKTDTICPNCNRRYSYTYCTHCDPSKKKPLKWIRYRDDSFLEDEAIVGQSREKNIPVQLRKTESMMRECTTTSFKIEDDKGKKKLKTLCPCCGQLLGD